MRHAAAVRRHQRRTCVPSSFSAACGALLYFFGACVVMWGVHGAGGGLFLFLDEFNCVSGCVQCDCHDFFLKRNF